MVSQSTASSSTVWGSVYSRSVIIGIYGVPGSGKSYLLGELKSAPKSPFTFYEGSEVIGDLVPGGLPAFKKLGEAMQTTWRGLAISRIQRECQEVRATGVVTGHYMFWDEGKEEGDRVITKADLEVYTHIIYLDIPASAIRDSREGDTKRERPIVSVEHLEKWKAIEKAELRSLCWENGIIFSLVSGPPRNFVDEVTALLLDFKNRDERSNLDLALEKVDRFATLMAASRGPQLDTILVVDADRTLAPQDTGALFWQAVAKSDRIWSEVGPDILKKLFGSKMGYSYTAFRQAALLYHEVAENGAFEALCDEASLGVTMHPEFVQFLRAVGTTPHVAVVVVTCGLSGVWERVLQREDIPRSVQVIGGGRTLDSGSLVVTPQIKAAIVDRLKGDGDDNRRVWAFGDSPLDIPMLLEADEAVVVVGEEHLRSKTMDATLSSAIKGQGLKARQLVLPKGSPPRLDTDILPLVNLTDDVIVNSLIRRHPQSRICHATERNSAKLLMTPTRNAKISGPSLRRAHHQVGRYLATEFLTEIIGVESYDIPHVQGGVTKGHRLLHEEKTVIAALMRGGESMAFGVSEAFPQATFLHARGLDDIDSSYVGRFETILLGNSGASSYD
ncbi:Uncharacterized protein SAPIO_CDS8714 [Scedosporium apiospermum]|uniref:Phosphoribosyltransferase domain-containing protein n=1 Tax=Pseudallescheria apiosperma TaxID=563466 RepID=A0A084G099_PSEDA|nr:Uncharacterized protein SAPIO_CDS8714 [Scedosporium apiospermum]KEZ40761.1 Uncharacterized protein SAPIO_CDS8714 [Scedosporium apiospermum]